MPELRGIILLCQGKIDQARAFFEQALDISRLWLSRSDTNPSVHAEQGLALAGLAECGDAGAVEPARQAYEKARSQCNAAGRVRHWSFRREQLKSQVSGKG